MRIVLLPGRVECLNEIQPGKICGAHRLADQVWCSVCGAPSRTRPVVPPAAGSSHRGNHLRVVPRARRAAVGRFSVDRG